MGKIVRNLFTTSTLMLLAIIVAAPSVAADPVNLALNISGVGFPSPLESDPGWGEGQNPWQLVDGQRSYDSWANGLAFYWDYQDHQATIDFGTPETFDQVILWHHGVDWTPLTTFLDYWDGTNWQPISFQRIYGTMHEEGSNSGYADSDIYNFADVTGSKVRYSFDGDGPAIDGSSFIHGWLYEFEVYESAVPEPASLLLLGTGLGVIGLAAWRRKKA